MRHGLAPDWVEINLWSKAPFQNRASLQNIIAGLQMPKFPGFEGLAMFANVAEERSYAGGGPVRRHDIARRIAL
jgi:hypothetical protein